MADKDNGVVQAPSSTLVKYLNIVAAAVGIASVVLDAAVPLAQQLGKKKEARAGLERAITMTILFTVIRTVPRLIGQLRKLRAQMSAPVAS